MMSVTVLKGMGHIFSSLEGAFGLGLGLRNMKLLASLQISNFDDKRPQSRCSCIYSTVWVGGGQWF